MVQEIQSNKKKCVTVSSVIVLPSFIGNVTEYKWIQDNSVVTRLSAG
jgi:hypothetical protein